MTTSATQWLNAFAEELGVEAPSDELRSEILALAGVAAHASERTAAPVACWLAAQAGLSASEAHVKALEVAVPEDDTSQPLS